uniref:Uncharacterized protein n=1 Tax=Chromera velia CCMP2878 TaxID=1169474 RepID=A0A0G4H6L0_9ALVE|eukprot:Cvel_24829.t1-p1 / transcript=Cvel_24829.t1 / gene=Cvel_24829 / organism=Chromera_velia_CCMP2878 / gene_product=hypothetical protein / transcript_product=hypothetical protein / location=Cvel_scaffold2738:4743-5174(+) / protein_length=144 / sequence_SO=supercontig / SO=protein_coding / is_pseudo=false
MVDGRISKEAAMEVMQEKGLKPESSWPNTSFFQATKAYSLGYGWGKELILRFLRARMELRKRGRLVLEREDPLSFLRASEKGSFSSLSSSPPSVTLASPQKSGDTKVDLDAAPLPSIEEEFFYFLKRPPTPRYMQRVIDLSQVT